MFDPRPDTGYDPPDNDPNDGYDEPDGSDPPNSD